MNDKFEKVYDKITAPDSLKQETLAMMERENEKYTRSDGRNKKSFGNRGLIFTTGIVAVAVFAAVLCVVLQRPVGVVYITDMTGGVYHDNVELEDGVIHFVSNRVSISVSPNVGNASADREQEAQRTENSDNLIEEITAKSGGTITFCRIFTIPIPEMTEDDWSYIGDQPIYVTVSKTEGIKYQANFEMEGQAYELVGVDVTQKEFIDYLYDKIK